MSKIKVVQIAYMGEDQPTEYLDDKCRVWWQKAILRESTPEDGLSTKNVFSHYEWQQIELPDEPTHPERAGGDQE
jgi:hypothetical protein